jgi:putative membrane protein
MSRYSEATFLDRHPLLVGAVAGLVAGVVSGASDRLLDHLVSDRQKRRDRRVRPGSAHQVAGPYLARMITGARLSRRDARRARTAFSVLYGVGWGMPVSYTHLTLPTN